MFSPASCDDEIQDLLLRRKMRLLHWLTPSHLGEVCMQMENPMVQEVYVRAQQGKEGSKVKHDKQPIIINSRGTVGMLSKPEN